MERHHGRVLSLNIGTKSQPLGKHTPTGITKGPVPAIEVSDPGPKRAGADGAGFSGVAGDYIGDGAHHGGSDQAVYAFAREEQDWWERELQREIPPGFFGENLTTQGLDVDAAEIGDVWRFGAATLRVSGPRIPCATFAGRMGERGWVKRFAGHGKSGAYLAVVAPGRIEVGEAISVEPSGSGIPVPLTLAGFTGNVEAARQVVAAHVFSGSDQEWFERVARRG